MKMTRLIAELAGPARPCLGWTGTGGDGILADAAAGAIGSSHGGGTVDIQRVVMSRRLDIGRPQGQSGAKLA